jgi:hypothetical protein
MEAVRYKSHLILAYSIVFNLGSHISSELRKDRKQKGHRFGLIEESLSDLISYVLSLYDILNCIYVVLIDPTLHGHSVQVLVSFM